MSKSITKRIILGIFLGLSIFVDALSQAKEFYVSPIGNDANSGTIDSPFASLEFARDTVKNYKALNSSDAITVYLRGGKYYMSAPLVFTSEDSGTENAPITYKAYQDEVPEILGGAKLTGLSWEKINDNVYKASVPTGLVFETLFINGEQKILARYPNYDENADKFNGTASDCLSSTRIATWADPTNGYYHVMHASLWGAFHFQITGKNGNNAVTLTGGEQNNRPENGEHDSYKFVENIYEELDDTDEWYLNRNTSELYFFPPSNLNLDTAEIEYAALEQLIVFNGTLENPVKYISIEGLELKRTIRTFVKNKEPLLRSDWTIFRGGAVHFEGTENCSLRNCELSFLGGNAVFFNHYNKNSQVSGCHIHDIGASGICFVGDTSAVRNPKYVPYGDFVSEAELDFTKGPKNDNYPQHCLVDNNLIHDMGRIEKQVAGVQISMSAYITVSRNSIYNLPRAGINIGEGAWGGHIVEYNDVFNTVLETGDHGSFNSWGRDRYWAVDRNEIDRRVEKYPDLVWLDMLDSNVIRNNRFRCDHGWDIDLDDGSAYYHIYNNVCLNGGIKLREGYHRKVENNVTVNNSMNVHVWLKNSGDIIRNNISTHKYYPIGMSNWGELLDSNLFYLEADLISIQNSYGTDENSIFGDPEFVDPDHGDFTVTNETVIDKIGWVNFSMDSFGVQVPQLKAIAEIPVIDPIEVTPDNVIPGTNYQGGIIKNITTIEELSAVGLGEMKGAMVMKAPYKWIFALVELNVLDVVLKLDTITIENTADFIDRLSSGTQYSTITVWRFQSELVLELPDFNSCDIPVELNSAEWELISTDSEVGPRYYARFAFDDNPGTFWHTQYSGTEPPYPHEIVVDMGKPYALSHLLFLPRQGDEDPRIKDFQLYVSSDLSNWGNPVLDSTLTNISDWQIIKIPEENDGQYFRFVGTSGWSRNAAAIAEISFLAGCGINAPSLSGVEENSNANFDIQIYPNPTTGKFHVQTVGLASNSELECKLFSIDGKKLLTYSITAQEIFSIDMSSFNKGMYFLQISDSEILRKEFKIILQ